VTDDAALEATPAHLRIVTSGVTPEEVAAVTAVVEAALEELAAEMTADSAPPVSLWHRGPSSVRGTLRPGSGEWRSFTG